MDGSDRSGVEQDYGAFLDLHLGQISILSSSYLFYGYRDMAFADQSRQDPRHRRRSFQPK